MARHNDKRDFERVVQIVSDTGGRVVGRTRLQKIAYLLEATGLGEGFTFEYRHFGPYSDDLASAARTATLLGALDEVEHPTSWGGFYSVYTVSLPVPSFSGSIRNQLASTAADANPIELELAATAAFLAAEGSADPWEETARRKPAKATPSRLAGAKELYRRLQSIQTPEPLPSIG